MYKYKCDVCGWKFNEPTKDGYCPNNCDSAEFSEIKTAPLYKVLNEQRTQGKVFTDKAENDSEIVLSYGNGSIALASFYCHPIDEETKANAQYTALAVNNLNEIADCLDTLLTYCKWIPKEVFTEEGRQEFHLELKRAKEALSSIS